MDWKAVTVTLKLRDSSFLTITRQVSLKQPADLTEEIYAAALVLLRKELHGQRIRLVGVTASNFREREQLQMFAEAGDPRRHKAAEALDAIRRKYGDRSMMRATLVRSELPAPFERDPMKAVRDELPAEGAERLGRNRRDTQPVTESDQDADIDA